MFDENYKAKFLEKGLLDNTGGELQHLISDAATMQIIRWTRGGFGMSAHNYDGDMLTDEVAQVHRSPGFITSTEGVAFRSPVACSVLSFIHSVEAWGRLDAIAATLLEPARSHPSLIHTDQGVRGLARHGVRFVAPAPAGRADVVQSFRDGRGRHGRPVPRRRPVEGRGDS